MNYIIFDLEATCWKNRAENKEKQHEIIEIGAVKIDTQGKLLDEFCAFIRPIIHPQLSPFCTKLTSIHQEDVAEAASFPKVIQNFKAWIEVEQANYYLCSWGFYDRKQLTADCQLHELPIEWLTRHISLKHQYASIHKKKRPIGLKWALGELGMSFEGTHHRGIDDARNIAKIFVQHIDDWQFEQ